MLMDAGADKARKEREHGQYTKGRMVGNITERREKQQCKDTIRERHAETVCQHENSRTGWNRR